MKTSGDVVRLSAVRAARMDASPRERSAFAVLLENVMYTAMSTAYYRLAMLPTLVPTKPGDTMKRSKNAGLPRPRGTVLRLVGSSTRRAATALDRAEEAAP